MGTFLKMRVSEIRVKRIRVNQGLGVQRKLIIIHICKHHVKNTLKKTNKTVLMNIGMY